MDTSKKKSCFVIMPISDHDGYEKGHFSRVYEHLIKPACEKAGFIPIRSDEEAKTNYIVIDILKRILDSDIVLCDLSAKNANVMYELGIRQAFNKKVVLIKDNKTERVFDIQGLRTISYDENLRVDEVQKNINSISDSLLKTSQDQSNDINSLIQLLSIKPASLPTSFELSTESSLILDALKELTHRMTQLESKSVSSTAKYPVNGGIYYKGEKLYADSEFVGCLVETTENAVILELDGLFYPILKTDFKYKKIDNLPF